MSETMEIELLHDDDMALCVRAIATLALDQNDDVRSSLAWMIRNRIEMLRASRRDDAVETACNAVLGEAQAKNVHPPFHHEISQAEWLQIKAMNERVWQGKIGDPTQGASACHRHNETPRWARQRTPTALLGEYLFFR